MTHIRFIRNDGQSIAIAIVRKRFFESAPDAELDPLHARNVWHDAAAGDADARELIEDLCDLEISGCGIGFGFLE